MKDVNVIVTPSGVSLNEEAHIYMNYEIPEIKPGGNPPSGKENRRTRRMLELRKKKGRL